ncbi:hypothetical protein [Pseudazoarcus pumilus]|uniref:Uncharacterized protein n=1 Tax=Pseudazoarcus pumilus TaxID=2067960 RepID=A0A2I6S9H1_9RHOO|nr:hypothetical protein [Pseudazoarcus pumilus]AUN95902.1 hypothetical protein C0099_13750 [Pseudazoarcus pumilus]
MTFNRLSQPMLELIASRPDGITTAEVVEQLGRGSNLVTTTAVRLKRKRLIEVPSTGLYRVTPAGRDWLANGRVIASGQGRRRHERTYGLRQRAWWLMREIRKFTVADLLTTLADGSERDPADNLRRWLVQLERVGVVQRMRRRVPGTAMTSNGHILWWLKRDLGRAAPVWRQRHGVVFDPNTGNILRPEAAEVSDA